MTASVLAEVTDKNPNHEGVWYWSVSGVVGFQWGTAETRDKAIIDACVALNRERSDVPFFPEE